LNIGVLGGTFDPVHLGHLILAEEASYQLKLNRVLWVLTPDPPHKSGMTILNCDDRRRLLDLAIGGNSTFALSDVDARRPAPHYAVDTVRLLRKEYPSDEIIYLIGSDSLRDLPGWYHPNDFVEACDGLGVMLRPGVNVNYDRLEQHIPGILRKIISLSAPSVDISSSDIRSRIANNQPFRYYLPQRVYKAIRESRFYQP
jgi:nicotinate-nucleotide adenylyltransferase